MGPPLQLNSTGKLISPKATLRNFSARASPAGAIREVWKGPLTFSGTTRLAPAWRASSPAFSTAAASPAMTSWVGQL